MRVNSAMLLESGSALRQHPAMLIGQRIRAARTRLKMTQADLARAAGVEQQTVSGWETDPERRPQRTLVPTLARILKVTPAHLEYGGADDRGRDYEHEPSAAEKSAARTAVAQLETLLLADMIKAAMRSIIQPFGLDVPDQRFEDAAEAAVSTYVTYQRLKSEDAA